MEFKNTKQKPALNNGFWVAVNTLDAFFEQLWNIASDNIKREIICDPVANSQVFSEKEFPDVSDLDKFVKIIDTVGHHTTECQNVSEDRLLYWTDGRRLDLHIYPYGTSVLKRAQWTAIHKGPNALIKTVETDKAGAATEEEVEALVEKLKDVHNFHYSAPHITWRTWADWILKKKVEQRELYVNKPPPYKIFDMFKAVGMNADQELASIHHEVSVAEGVTEGVSLDISGLIQSFKSVMACTRAQQAAEEVHLQKLEAFQTRMTATKETLELVGHRTRPVENALSLEYLNKITNTEDVDHAEYLEDDEVRRLTNFFFDYLSLLNANNFFE